MLENEASGYQAVKDLMMTDLEVRSNRQFEAIMSRKFEWAMSAQDYVAEKQRAGKKLKLRREKVMEAISRVLPAQFRWIKSEEELETLYELIRGEKTKFGEMRAKSMTHEAANQMCLLNVQVTEYPSGWMYRRNIEMYQNNENESK